MNLDGDVDDVQKASVREKWRKDADGIEGDSDF